MRARSAVVMSVVVVCLLAAACSGSSKPAAEATSTTSATRAAPAITSEAQLEDAIVAHGLTPSSASQEFALAVGPLPGVATKGMTPDPDNFDGTQAALDLQAEWNHLSAAQQHAAAKDLTSSHEITVAGPGQTTTTIAARRAPPAQVVLVAHTDVPTYDYSSLAQTADTEEGTELGQPAIVHFVIDVDDTPEVPNSKDKAVTTYYHWNFLRARWEPWPDGCHILVNTAEWGGIDAESAAAIMAHEVFHCYQQRSVGTNEAARTVGRWVAEGEATWVMAQLHPTASVVAAKWDRYVSTPDKKFDDRAYDAIGVFGHYGDVAGDQSAVWPQLLPTYAADVGAADSTSTGSQDSDALQTLIGSTSDRFYAGWGPSYFLDAAGVDWHMGGPGPVSSSGPSPDTVTIGNDDGQDIGLLDPYLAHQVTIDGDADILVITLASGYGEVHDQGYGVSVTLDDMAPLKLCLRSGGCACPDGSPGASAITTQATGPISVGLDGGDHSLAAYAAGLSLDKFCKKPDPQPPTGSGQPPPGTGGGGGGGGVDPDPDPKQPGGVSEGDPHLSTFDGRYYDLQAAGELTMVRSTSGDLEVQARLVPVPGSSTVAVNQAVAAKVDGHRVTLSLENGSIVARLDGNALTQVDNRAGAGTVDRQGTTAASSWVVEWPDGTRLEVVPLGLQGLNLQMWSAADRAAKLVGPFGNDNGKPADDLALADGSAVSPIDDHTLDTTYADSWRVTQATSLFDYAPGQTTATFTDTSFPQGPESIPDRAAITAQCRGDGITDPYLLQACIVDGSAIHDPAATQAVLGHYAQAQTVRTVHYDLAHHVKPFKASGSSTTPTSSPSGSSTPGTVGGSSTALRTLVDSGRVNGPTESPSFAFDAKAGDVIWIGPPGCDSQLTLALKDPAGKVLDPDDVSLGLPGCQIGRFALTRSGTYHLVANPDHKGTGSYGIPIRFERPDVVRSTAYGRTLSGSIPMTAAHDVYRFSARAGDDVHISGSGCSLGFAHPTVVGQQDNVEIATGAGKGLFTLGCESSADFHITQSGTYEAVVNGSNVGPLSYRFVLQK